MIKDKLKSFGKQLLIIYHRVFPDKIRLVEKMTLLKDGKRQYFYYTTVNGYFVDNSGSFNREEALHFFEAVVNAKAQYKHYKVIKAISI